MLKAILFNDTSVEDHHGCAIVIAQLLKGFREHGVKVVRRVPLGMEQTAYDSLPDWLAGMDLCLINGEGTMHDDAPAAMVLGEVAKFCAAKGIPCFLLNSVWQDNVRLNDCLPCFTSVYFRDSASAATAAPFRQQVAVVPDLTLLTDFSPWQTAQRSGLLLNGSNLPERRRELISYAFSGTPPGSEYMSIRCLPNLVGGSFAAWRFSLSQTIKDLRSWLQACTLPMALSPQKKHASRWRWRHARLRRSAFLARIARAQAVVSGRYHMVTLCIASHTPFLAVPSKTRKIQSLLADIGLSGRIYSSFPACLEACPVAPFTAEEIHMMEVYLASARASARQMFADIALQASNVRK